MVWTLTTLSNGRKTVPIGSDVDSYIIKCTEKYVPQYKTWGSIRLAKAPLGLVSRTNNTVCYLDFIVYSLVKLLKFK